MSLILRELVAGLQLQRVVPSVSEPISASLRVRYALASMLLIRSSGSSSIPGNGIAGQIAAETAISGSTPVLWHNTALHFAG